MYREQRRSPIIPVTYSVKVYSFRRSFIVTLSTAHDMIIIIAFISTLPYLTTALHCLVHEHCGPNAVCVTSLDSPNPKCMCLVGYTGNGARCQDDGSQRRLPAQVGSGNSRIVIEKCSNASAELPARPQHHDHHAHEQHNHDDARLQNVDAGSLVRSSSNQLERPRVTTVSPISSGSASSPCAAVVCDFDKGPCQYRNDRDSEWHRRQIGKGQVVISHGASLSRHYLLSNVFELREPAELIFTYFDSSKQREHLSLSSNELRNIVWRAKGSGAGWRLARVRLDPGVHQLIFGSEDLKENQLVALDKIRLTDISDGRDTVCYV